MNNLINAIGTINIIDLSCDEERDFPYDLTNIRSSTSKSLSRDNSEAGIISVINSKNNGKRIMLSTELMDELNWPETVQFGFGDHFILISQYFSPTEPKFVVKNATTKGIIYSSSLVEEVTRELGLDFTDKTSITLHDVKYLKNNREYPCAIIKSN